MSSNIHQLTDEDRGNIKKEFLQDLPSPETYDQELDRWQQRAQEMETDAKSHQLVDLLGSTTLAQFYPSVHAMLSLLLTLPVGSCSCERSFSAPRRLKTWTRTSMGGDQAKRLGTSPYSQRAPTGQRAWEPWSPKGVGRLHASKDRAGLWTLTVDLGVHRPGHVYCGWIHVLPPVGLDLSQWYKCTRSMYKLYFE